MQQLLRLNNIALNKKELEFQIQSHPSYPSLHAITGVLDHFNIDNIALDVPIDESTLSQLPQSFLAQLKGEHGGGFAVIVNKGIHYEVILSKKKKNKLTIGQFLDIFTGIIVAVAKTDLEEVNKDNSSFLDISLVVISALVLCSLFFLAKPVIGAILFLLTSILGIVISITLKKQEQGVQTVLGNAFCSGESKTKNCDAVLTSKGASVLGKYKLSDISIIYFSGLAFAVFTLTVFSLDLSLPFVIGLLAFPITLYSIYYQAVVVKKWCLLCLNIVCILWVQAALSTFNINAVFASTVSFQEVLLTSISFIGFLTIYNTLAPLFKVLRELEKIKIDHFKFKRNFNLFGTLLGQSKTIDTNINDVSEIVFGNPDSNLEITIVTSPFCGHCKPVHTLVEDILKKYQEKVMIITRFNANVNSPENNLVKVASRLIEIYNTSGSKACLNAMHRIYSGQRVDEWIKEFGMCSNKAFIDTLEKESEWCKTNALNFTPAIFINGKSFPKEYDRGDLIYFIEDLHENYTIDTTELQLTI